MRLSNGLQTTTCYRTPHARLSSNASFARKARTQQTTSGIAWRFLRTRRTDGAGFAPELLGSSPRAEDWIYGVRWKGGVIRWCEI